MQKIITSSNNNIVKKVLTLHQKSGRDKTGQFFIEGYRIVDDALQSNASFEFVIVSQQSEFKINNLVEQIKKRNILVYTVSDKLFEQISDTKTPQGILAVIKQSNFNIDNIIYGDNLFIILLENIQDPGNMGTIIRTADAVGALAVVVSKGCVDVYNPKVLRSTMGSVFHLPIIKTENFENTVISLKNKGFNMYAAHLDGKTNHFEVDMKCKTGVIIGNEANGISNHIAKYCNLIKIPMPGNAESLNASVSAGIIMYEYVRQKYFI